MQQCFQASALPNLSLCVGDLSQAGLQGVPLVSTDHAEVQGSTARAGAFVLSSHGIATMDSPINVVEHVLANDVGNSDVRTRQRLGSVAGLRIRPNGSPDPQEVDQLLAIPGLGIHGDTHAHALSPRQVLLAGFNVYRDLGLKAMTFRENLLVDFNTDQLASSALLQVGPEVVLWLTFQCEACGHLERRHPGVAKALDGRRGTLARVLRGGRVFVGDEVHQFRSSIPPISSVWQERIAGVLNRVPAGKRIEYRQLARLAGVPKAYCRVFPKILSQLPPTIASKAQAGTVADTNKRWTGEDLFDVSKDIGSLTELAH
jgi:MOSC domain